MSFDDQYATSGVLGEGGMAVVYSARRRDGRRVALKRPRAFPLCDDRLKREVAVLSKLDHPNVMPVLGYGVDDEKKWFYAMPIARGSLKKLKEAGSIAGDLDALCADVLRDVGNGLAAMHHAGYVHRDVKPHNILALDDASDPRGYRWVIADCGLVRRPIGETTVGLTGSVSLLGTDGYIAPEAFGDPHGVTEAADVYSLGRVLAWLTTGQNPVLTRQLLPSGEWRPVVRELTYEDPERRPQTMVAAMARAEQLRSTLPVSEKANFRSAVRSAGGMLAPHDAFWEVVQENLDDYDFMIDDLVEVQAKDAARFAKARPAEGAEIAERLALHLSTGDYGRRSWDRLNVHLGWIQAVLRSLIEVGHVDLFGDVAPTYFDAVRLWDRYQHNSLLRSWLSEVRGPAADAAARAISSSGSVDYFKALMEGQRFSNAALAGLLEQ